MSKAFCAFHSHRFTCVPFHCFLSNNRVYFNLRKKGFERHENRKRSHEKTSVKGSTFCNIFWLLQTWEMCQFPHWKQRSRCVWHQHNLWLHLDFSSSIRGYYFPSGGGKVRCRYHTSVRCLTYCCPLGHAFVSIINEFISCFLLLLFYPHFSGDSREERQWEETYFYLSVFPLLFWRSERFKLSFPQGLSPFNFWCIIVTKCHIKCWETRT